MRLTLLIMAFSLLFGSLCYGQSLSARISNARVEGPDFKWDVEINRTDDWGTGGGNDILGNCDFYFYVNSSGFTADNPALDNIHISLDGNGNYSFATGRAIANTQCYVALSYDMFGGGSNWYPPLNSWELIFTVSLPIDDPALTSGLSWNESSTGFSRGNMQPLTAILTINGDSDISLPVELTSFSASQSGSNVLLKWITQSENSNQGFEVWRAGNQAENFSEISSYKDNKALKGQGNTSTRHDYTYTDRSVTVGETYFYKIADVSVEGHRTFHGPLMITISLEEVLKTELPVEYSLTQNYPNPFNPKTKIRFAVPEAVQTKLSVYDGSGQLIGVLMDKVVAQGTHFVEFDGVDLTSGVYYYRIATPEFVEVKKMVLLK